MKQKIVTARAYGKKQEVLKRVEEQSENLKIKLLKIKRTPIENSSRVASFAFIQIQPKEFDFDLILEYHSKNPDKQNPVYMYGHITFDLIHGFMDAESKGKWVEENLINKENRLLPHPEHPVQRLC